MARILPIAVVGLALVLYALWRGAYPDLFEEPEPPPAAETEPAQADEAAAGPEAPAVAPAAAPDKLPVKPELDVVRIDKDGDTVIAGKAEPGASVTVATQDETLATVTADERGKWVALPDKPLPEGDHAVKIEATGKDGKTQVGDKTIVVSIPEGNKDAKPLVIAVPTGDFGASEVLQRPESPPAAGEPAGMDREPPPAAPAETGTRIAAAAAPKPPEPDKPPAEQQAAMADEARAGYRRGSGQTGPRRRRGPEAARATAGREGIRARAGRRRKGGRTGRGRG